MVFDFQDVENIVECLKSKDVFRDLSTMKVRISLHGKGSKRDFFMAVRWSRSDYEKNQISVPLVTCGEKAVKCTSPHRDPLFKMWFIFVFGISLEDIKKYKMIKFHIEFSDEPETCALLSAQHESLYAFSKLHGDVSLILKPREGSLYNPALKKRKLSNVKNKNKSDSNSNSLDDDDDLKHVLKFSANILCSASKVFERMLTVEMKEKTDKVIEIEAQNEKDVNDMLYFMCTDRLRSDSNALAVIELAHYYQMDRLFSRCIRRLFDTVPIASFVSTICIFDKYEISHKYESLIEFGKKWIEDLRKQNNFDKLPHSVRCMISAKK